MAQSSYRPAIQPAAPPEGVRKKSRGINYTFLAIVAGLSFLLLMFIPILVAFGTYAYYQVNSLILPGIYVGVTELTGFNPQEAAVELHKTWNLENVILAEDGLHSWNLRPSDLGLTLDPVQTAEEAYKVGHGQSMVAEVAEMIYAFRNGWGIPPVINFNHETANAMLVSMNAQIYQPAQDGTITYVDGEFIPVESELGYEINIEESLKPLIDNPIAVLESGQLNIILKPVLPQVTDVSDSLTKAQHLLNTPVIMRGYDPIYDEKFEWIVPRDVVGSWITISPGDQGPVINVDQVHVNDYLSTLDEELGPERWIDPVENTPIIAQAMRSEQPATLSVRHKPFAYIVKPGDTLLKIGWDLGFPFWMILNANPGIDPDNLIAGQVLNIPSRNELIPLPVIENKRIVLSISKQRLWVYENGELLGKHVISTGIDRSPTQPGVFQVQTHDPKAYASVWDLTMPNFLGIYEAWPGFMNGIHGLPTLSNGRRLWANILGRPASYGCIILDLKTAKWLYNWAEDGVVVEIEA